jgi:hypothetical protein
MDTSIKTQLPGDKTLTGVFTNRSSAERAYDVLKELNYDKESINILMSDEARLRYFPAPELKGEVIGDKVKEGPGLGGVVGAGTGSALGAIIGAAASLFLPGGVLVVGPIAAALTGALVGGLSGGMVGSLFGIGIPEEHAKSYEEQIQQGNILIAVNPRSAEEGEQIAEEWRNLGGEVIIHKVPN